VPLVDGIVNHVLLQSGPDLNQSLSQLVQVLHFFVLDPILRHSRNLVGHRSGEMNAGVSRCSSLIVSRALCADALSCCNTKSPDAVWHVTTVDSEAPHIVATVNFHARVNEY